MESPFKSKLITAYDYTKVDLSGFCEPFEVDEEALAASLLSVRKKYASLESVSTAEKGDFVTLSCQSEKPKFQKNSIDVCIGKNLYSKELEEKLIGLSSGTETVIDVDGLPVLVSVKEIRRSILLELTDESVASNFSIVHTVSELREWYVKEQFENDVRN